MQIAQKLYQGIEIEGETIGLITYMRTDGTNLSKDAISSFRDYIKKEIGNEYLPENALNYSGKKQKMLKKLMKQLDQLILLELLKVLKNI